MKLVKNGVTFDVKSDIQINAFLSSGYKRADEDVIEAVPEETTETAEAAENVEENVEEKTKKRGAANGDSKQ